jgi:WD40 repeat protein
MPNSVNGAKIISAVFAICSPVGGGYGHARFLNCKIRAQADLTRSRGPRIAAGSSPLKQTHIMSAYMTEEERKDAEKAQKRRVSRQQIIEHVKKSLLFTAFDVKWVPSSASCVAIGHYPNNQGALTLFQLSKGELKAAVEVRKPLPFKCGTFGHSTSDTRLLATGDFAGNLELWDVDRGMADAVFSMPKAHSAIINSIDGALADGPPEIVTGSRDGSVKVWDARQSAKPVVALNPADPARARDCWTVRFGNSHSQDERCVAAGYDNGDVKIFDLRTQQMIHEFNVSNGVCDMEFDRMDIPMNKLVVSSLEGRVRCYDMRTLHPELGYAYVEDRVTSGTVWQSRSLPQNRDIFISGGAGELTLCKYLYPPERSLKDEKGVPKGIAGTIEELNRVKVGDQPINALDWHKQREGLLACAGFDQCIRIMLVTKLGAV